jgi:Fe2+ transport system protein FeoA
MSLAENGTAASQLVPLSLLRAGQAGQVERVDGASDFLHRLREMGLRQGVEVCMLRPGRPCIVRIGCQKLCFRAVELEGVQVRTRVG